MRGVQHSRREAATCRGWRRGTAVLVLAVLAGVVQGCAVQRHWAAPPGVPGEPPVAYSQPGVDLAATLLWMFGMLLVQEAASSAVTAWAHPDPISPLRYWQDPDDWVGQCPGPLNCPSYQIMHCRGVAGHCRCSCEYDAAQAAALERQPK